MTQSKIKGKETISTIEGNNTRREVNPPLAMKLFPMSTSLARKSITMIALGGPSRKEKVTTNTDQQCSISSPAAAAAAAEAAVADDVAAADNFEGVHKIP